MHAEKKTGYPLYRDLSNNKVSPEETTEQCRSSFRNIFTQHDAFKSTIKYVINTRDTRIKSQNIGRGHRGSLARIAIDLDIQDTRYIRSRCSMDLS